MDIRILIGMPLGYAKSVLEKEHIAYEIEETVPRSHFFTCDHEAVYVIRTIQRITAFAFLLTIVLKPVNP